MPLISLRAIMSSGYTPSRFSILTAERPSLDQFVLLSLMLHVLAILLFGDTTGGSARRGEKLWGALTVNVQRLLPHSSAGLKSGRGVASPVASARNTQPASVAPETPSPNRDVRASTSTPIEASPPITDAAPPVQATTFEMPTVISTDVEKAVTEFVVPKASNDRVLSPPPPAEPVPRVAPAALPSVPLPVIKAPVSLPASRVIDQSMLSPLPIAIPVEPVPRKEAVIVPATLSDLPAPMIEREAAKPVVTAPEPKLREIVPPIVPPPVAASPAPLKPEREIIQPIAPPARADAPTPAPLEREAMKPTTPPQAPGVAATTAPARTPPSASSGTPSGTPNVDRDLLKPRGDASAAPTETNVTAPALGKAPAIDLDAVRKRAREINSGAGSRTLFAFPGTPPPKPKSKEQQAFDKALKKNDCRDAYADMGLAAVLPLVLDSVREGGCKW